mmetsp:Transcript_101635/g.292770  ORF Transcript_101635/g.292770 Transcript_101635/m.292770 type:complete len:480 (-) Transcript_101635:51-1490(-)
MAMAGRRPGGPALGGHLAAGVGDYGVGVDPADDFDDVPNVVTVVGRHRERENEDLAGEYVRITNFHGRPAYRKAGTRTCIRYWSIADRWLIDREGLQESDTCNAYAEQGGARHPASEDLVWRVWESRHKQHVRDPEMLVTACPASIQVIGRAAGRENFALNGTYKLIGLHSGKVAYQKEGERHCIRYWALGDRWLLDLEGLRDVDVCNAYADAHGGSHPGTPGLTWYVWDTARGKHVLDSTLQSIVAPPVVEVVGREAPKENVAMNGTYHLVGLFCGRPAYMKADGTGHAIRYWPREDRWLIDLDGLRDLDLCNAYAESIAGVEHPGDLQLVWNVWETSRGRHLSDPAVRTFTAPHWVKIFGRDQYKENAAVNGEYELVDIVEGKPAYRKVDADHVIRYWPCEDRWVIDLEAGFQGGDIANAYADAKGAEHPGNTELLWYVWETSRGCHVADEDLIAEGKYIELVDWSKVPGMTKRRED